MTPTIPYEFFLIFLLHMNMLAYDPTFREWFIKLWLPESFLILQYLPKLYKKSKAVVRLVRQEIGKPQAEA